MRVSVVIPVRNGERFLAAACASVRAQTRTAEEVRIIVDPTSTDGSVDRVRAEFPQVRVLALPANDGPAAAREAGFRAATTSLVGFVDNDVTPAPDCFARLAAALAAKDRAVLAMPRVVHASAPDTVQFDGAVLVHRRDQRVAVGQAHGGDRLLDRHLPDRLAVGVVLDHAVVAHFGDEDMAVGKHLHPAAGAFQVHAEALQLLAGRVEADDP